MPSGIRRTVFAHIAATSIALSAGSPAAAAELAALPEDALSEVIDEAERGSGAGEERRRVLQWIAADARPFIRAEAAAAAGALFTEQPEATLALLGQLAGDSSEVVRSAASLGLARALDRASAVERIQIVCDWALSAHSASRAAIARALATPVPMFVTDIALECLASDPDATVRLSALLAAAAHFDQAPAVYGGIAERLSTDPDRRVRKAARSLINMKSRGEPARF